MGHCSQNLRFWLQSGQKSQKKNSFYNLFLMGLGQDQQKHTTVHTGGVSRGRVHGCGCWGHTDPWPSQGRLKKSLFQEKNHFGIGIVVTISWSLFVTISIDA